MAIAGLLAVAFVGLAASMEAGQTAGLDAGAGAARGAPGTAWARTFEAITDLGGAWVVIAVSGLGCALLIQARRYADALLVAVAVAGSRALTALVKVVLARERPAFPDAIAVESTFAFPSGHASAATALYGALALLVLRSGLAKWARLSAAVVLGVLIAAIGFSRVYLGVHYASDVIGGVLVGGASIAAAAGVSLRLTSHGRHPGQA